jgi:hypothetical protein
VVLRPEVLISIIHYIRWDLCVFCISVLLQKLRKEKVCHIPFFSFFFAELGFEFKALCLQSRCSSA